MYDWIPNVTSNPCHQTVVQWYLKNNHGLTEKFSTLKQLTIESMNQYIELKYVHVCELAFVIGWVVGGGDIKQLPKLKTASRAFAMIYKISIDFQNLHTQIVRDVGYSCNYIINFGLEAGYEKFISNKQQFIEAVMLLDIYTNTLKEIVDDIEEHIDYVIDQTSPDLKSTCSNMTRCVGSQTTNLAVTFT